jgi:uncharacterized membrane protein (DUF485 family)
MPSVFKLIFAYSDKFLAHNLFSRKVSYQHNMGILQLYFIFPVIYFKKYKRARLKFLGVNMKIKSNNDR